MGTFMAGPCSPCSEGSPAPSRPAAVSGVTAGRPFRRRGALSYRHATSSGVTVPREDGFAIASIIPRGECGSSDHLLDT